MNEPEKTENVAQEQGGSKEKGAAKANGLNTAVAVVAGLALAVSLVTGVSVLRSGGSAGGQADDAAVEQPAAQSDGSDAAGDEDGPENGADASGASKEDGTSSTSTGATEAACEHDWTLTYTTVHHDAVTHTETVAPKYENQTSYHTVCNDCQQVIDGIADAHIKATGHSGYSTNVPIVDEVLVSNGYTYEVEDEAAYDETVPDKMVCTICGETQEVTAASDTAEA